MTPTMRFTGLLTHPIVLFYVMYSPQCRECHYASFLWEKFDFYDVLIRDRYMSQVNSDYTSLDTTKRVENYFSLETNIPVLDQTLGCCSPSNVELNSSHNLQPSQMVIPSTKAEITSQNILKENIRSSQKQRKRRKRNIPEDKLTMRRAISNDRERCRVKRIRGALDIVSKNLPVEFKTKRMKQLDVLNGAIDYIRYLNGLLNEA